MSDKQITTHIGGAGTAWPPGPLSPEEKKKQEEKKRGR